MGEKEALLKEEYFEDAFDKKAEKLEKEREEKRRKFKKFYENSQNQSLKGLIFTFFSKFYHVFVTCKIRAEYGDGDGNQGDVVIAMDQSGKRRKSSLQAPPAEFRSISATSNASSRPASTRGTGNVKARREIVGDQSVRKHSVGSDPYPVKKASTKKVDANYAAMLGVSMSEAAPMMPNKS